jgi:protein phosphatase 1E
VKNGQISFLTTEHKPENETEKARIISAGGNVSFTSNCWRIDSSLAVSRSFGDVDYQPSVISAPELMHFELDGDEDFVIIGCDGLWETLDPTNICSLVYEYAMEAVTDKPDVNIAEFLVKKAQSNGSMDNITAIFVLLKENFSSLTKPE